MKIPTWVGPAFKGAIGGAIAISVAGFGLGWWVTSSTAEQTARHRAEAAVVAVLTPICIENFRRQPDFSAKLTELKQVAFWQQRDFIEKGGFATMPGSTTPNSTVASICAEKLGAQ